MHNYYYVQINMAVQPRFYNQVYRVAQKECSNFVVNFKNIVDETDFFFYFLEHSFSNKMTP